jgi:hypothetical protein
VATSALCERRPAVVPQKKLAGIAGLWSRRGGGWGGTLRHGAPGGTGHLVACPLAGGASSWLGWVTARRRGRA